ncbi:MAG: ferritin-like domain-containing protein, partial [Parasphingopyxis sp.]|uniref:ferritin-like domain-containing protein n=1 Tax=Parasphingopyxis sp. TaxID=1920299 RepID=UPI0032F01DED
IDLAFDLIGRFGGEFPRDFVDDWIRVGAEEAMHFALLDRRLRSLGSGYGALPAHGGLWESAQDTAHDRVARLAVVPMVLEARGLDVTPATVDRFRAAGDKRSAEILERIARDEIRHVHFGVKWFESCCAEQDLLPEAHWQLLVKRYFNGRLKPPFNASARRQAGLSREYYLPLASVEPC